MTVTPPPPFQPIPSGQSAPYAPQNWQPVAKRPPLTPEAKSGSRWAGIVGFNLISLGWFLFVVPVMLSLFAAFFTFIIGQIGRSSGTFEREYTPLKNFVDSIDVNLWVVPLLLVAVLGVIVWALGIFISGLMLKSHGVNHPWGVTWAATGIAILTSWFLDWVAGIFVQIAATVMSLADTPVWTGTLIGGGIALVVTIAIHTVIGWLAWWWMAHAMRSRRSVA